MIWPDDDDDYDDVIMKWLLAKLNNMQVNKLNKRTLLLCFIIFFSSQKFVFSQRSLSTFSSAQFYLNFQVKLFTKIMLSPSNYHFCGEWLHFIMSPYYTTYILYLCVYRRFFSLFSAYLSTHSNSKLIRRKPDKSEYFLWTKLWRSKFKYEALVEKWYTSSTITLFVIFYYKKEGLILHVHLTH